MTDGDTCTCGDVLDEHVEDSGQVGGCQVEGCPCVHFEASE